MVDPTSILTSAKKSTIFFEVSQRQIQAIRSKFLLFENYSGKYYSIGFPKNIYQPSRIFSSA